ncbi:MAG: DinB family protein, partial [Chloroflexota bacterium]
IDRVKFIDTVIKRHTDGLNHEDSMQQLDFPANCMNWNLGHLLVYRMEYLGAIDGTTAPNEEEWAMYGAGSEPLTDSEAAIQLETLLNRLAEVSDLIVSALETVSAEQLDTVYNEERDMSLDDYLNFYLIFHEAYHAGQLEILKELALAER